MRKPFLILILWESVYLFVVLKKSFSIFYYVILSVVKNLFPYIRDSHLHLGAGASVGHNERSLRVT